MPMRMPNPIPLPTPEINRLRAAAALIPIIESRLLESSALAESALWAGKIDSTTNDQIIEKLNEVKEAAGKETADALEKIHQASRT